MLKVIFLIKDFQVMKRDFITCKHTNETKFKIFAINSNTTTNEKIIWLITKTVCQSLHYAIPKYLAF